MKTNPRLCLFVIKAILFVASAGIGPLQAHAQGPKTDSPVGRVEQLTDYDKELISIYTGSAYAFLNRDLRSCLLVEGLKTPFCPNEPSKILAKDSLKMFTHFKRALAKTPAVSSEKDGPVYRGIYVTSFNPKAAFRVGKMIRDGAFGSASLDRAQAELFARGKEKILNDDEPPSETPDPKKMVLIAIRSRTARNIGPISYFPEEKEVLFLPGTLFRVEKSERDAEGVLMVEMTELEDRNLTPADRDSLDGTTKIKQASFLSQYYEPGCTIETPCKKLEDDLKKAAKEYQTLISSRDWETPISKAVFNYLNNEP